MKLMELNEDKLNTIALNMIYTSKCKITKKLGKLILKSSKIQIITLHAIFWREFEMYLF